MNDLISRQAAIDMFQNLAYDDWNQGTGTTWANAFAESADMIEELPSAEPERRIGKWIYKERREPQYDIVGVKTWGIAYFCSECGFIHSVIEDFGHYSYCPNCGARMEGDER